MKKGSSLLEAMLSLFLGSFILIAGNNFLSNVKITGKKTEKLSEQIAEKSISLFQLTSILKSAGEGIPYELGVELSDGRLIIRKSIASYELLNEAKKGEQGISVECAVCKKGKRVLIKSNIYTILEKGSNYIVLDNPLYESFPEGEEIKVLKEYVFSSDSSGIYMKIDRGYFQLISKEYFDVKFKMFTETVVKLEGKEREGKRVKDFEYYVYLPYISVNGGVK